VCRAGGGPARAGPRGACVARGRWGRSLLEGGPSPYAQLWTTVDLRLPSRDSAGALAVSSDSDAPAAAACCGAQAVNIRAPCCLRRLRRRLLLPVAGAVSAPFRPQTRSLWPAGAGREAVRHVEHTRHRAGPSTCWLWRGSDGRSRNPTTAVGHAAAPARLFRLQKVGRRVFSLRCVVEVAAAAARSSHTRTPMLSVVETAESRHLPLPPGKARHVALGLGATRQGYLRLPCAPHSDRALAD